MENPIIISYVVSDQKGGDKRPSPLKNIPCEIGLKKIALKHQLSQCCQSSNYVEYRKSSIKPPGALFNFGPSRGGLNKEGLIREGGLLERGLMAYS